MSMEVAGIQITAGQEQYSGRLWGLYIIAVVLLVPVVKPAGPGQLAIVDILNTLALALFFADALINRRRVQLPFFIAVLMISAGSLLAVTNSVSLSQSFLTLIQDFYLYLWFVLLVNVLSHCGNLKKFMVAWLWTASVVALLGLGIFWFQGHGSFLDLLGPKGMRADATFYNSEMFADYLVISLFIALGLSGQISRWPLWSSIVLMFLALLATKSNGGVFSLLAGLAGWALARSVTRNVSLLGLSAFGLLIMASVILAWWLSAEWGVMSNQFKAIEKKSFIGRMSHSYEGRTRIWNQLQQMYVRSPLGIGPGNSRTETVSFAHQERPDSLKSKEAHNDYLAYLIERGPLALAGLLLMTVQAFMMIGVYWKQVAEQKWRAAEGGVLTAALVGALVATLTHSMVIEKLHFRHFWLFLALVCALTGPMALSLSMKGRPQTRLEEQASHGD